MSANIQIAQPSDLGRFSVLWKRYLTELRELGGDMLPTPKNIRFFCGLFASYTQKQLRGVCVLGNRHSCLIWGEIANPLDTIYENWAVGWGTYVDRNHRGQGLSKAMRDVASAELREMGFSVVIGDEHFKNDNGASVSRAYGFEPFATRVCLKLGS